jgi:hypothetical protein
VARLDASHPTAALLVVYAILVVQPDFVIM